jgi:uncharacterized repeat protein (TIGR03803 family)
MRSKKPLSTARPIFVIFVTLLLASIIVPAQTQATKFNVLHTFKGSDGLSPASRLVRDPDGNLYGTTEAGGAGKCKPLGCGTVFKLDKNGKQIWLHSFNGKNGSDPMTGLLRDEAGDLYGTTVYGGQSNNICGQSGCGVVFKLDAMGSEGVLHRFQGGTDGWETEALLIENHAGDLYGTTLLGGEHNYGTVFKLDKSGRETILHSFDDTDGYEPFSGVIADAAGNLFGTTAGGGTYGYGTVFEIDTAGTASVLYDFSLGSDGAIPVSALIRDSAGNLYGTTEEGGNLNCAGGSGCGVVFELSPTSGGDWTEKVLYTFCSASNCTDGAEPLSGPLLRDSGGNLYGTTYRGGINCNGDGCGIVFELDATGRETVLHTFTGGVDGASPWAGLIMDTSGTLYGTAQLGGDNNCVFNEGCGTVFKVILPH